MSDTQKYDYCILKCSPDHDGKQELIGPFKTIEERDKECARLTKEEIEKTKCLPNGQRMTKKSYSFYRTDVIWKEADNVKKAA